MTISKIPLTFRMRSTPVPELLGRTAATSNCGRPSAALVIAAVPNKIAVSPAPLCRIILYYASRPQK